MSYNDPTERDADQAQLLEPIQVAAPYYDTYDYAQYPYSPYAPPPPREKKKIFIIVFAVMGSMILVLGGIIIGVLLLKQNGANTSITPTQTPNIHPTLVSTVMVPTLTSQNTQVPQISYSAGDVYSAFSQAGISMSSPINDSNWKCCTYYPQGGALVWTDLPTGLSIDIATFANNTEAYVDDGELINQGFSSTSYRNCLLSYETTFPQSELTLYTRTMTNVCT